MNVNVSYDFVKADFQFVCVNPFLTNGFSHHYHFGESTFFFRGVNFRFLFYFSVKFPYASRIAPDGMPRFAASNLGLY